jgi:hypothetical protein
MYLGLKQIKKRKYVIMWGKILKKNLYLVISDEMMTMMDEKMEMMTVIIIRTYNSIYSYIWAGIVQTV